MFILYRIHNLDALLRVSTDTMNAQHGEVCVLFHSTTAASLIMFV